MKILVTGGTGFTGSHLCRRLVGDGHRVRALVRDSARAAFLSSLGIELVSGDLRSADSLPRAVQGIDVVYHVAALFRPENVPHRDFWDTNAAGTESLLNAGAKAGVRRFIHCSTVGVHGAVSGLPADERSPYAPGDHYQASKAEGERLALRYVKEGRLPGVVVRPAGIYGPGDLRFLKLFRTIKNRSFVMLGSGEVHYQMTYIDDLIDGILLCGARENAVGNVYILAGDERPTLNGLVETVAQLLRIPPPRFRFPIAPVYGAAFCCELICRPLGIQPPLYRRRVDFFRKSRCFDNSKAKSELGFQPRTDLRSGLRLTIDWYKKEGLL